MRKQIAVKAAKILVLAGVVATPSWAGEQVRLVYKGESSAEAVCMSIARDSVPDLRRAFRHGRTRILERSHLVYECNDLALDEFAFTMNAVNVSTYLTPMFGDEGHVTIEQVGSLEN